MAMSREIRQPRTNVLRAKREKSLRRARVLRLEHLERRACPAVVAAPQSVSILEGKSRDVAFRLDQAPTAAVTFTVESSNPTQFAIEPSALTFTPENWRVRQVVRVAAVQDFIKDGRTVGSLITGRISSDDERYARKEVRDVAITVQDSRVDLLQFQGAYTGSVTGRGDVSGTVRFVVTGRNVTADMVVTAPAIDLDERSLMGSGTIDPSGRVNVVSNDLDAPVRFSGRVVVGKTGIRVVNTGSWQYGGNTSGKWRADSPPQQVADDPFLYTPLFAMGVPETSGAPGVAGAVYLKKGDRQEIFAAGQRGVNPATNKNAGPVSTNDVWHLGSNTKAMTCTLLALMIQEGRPLPKASNPFNEWDPVKKLDWDTPVTDIFPEFESAMKSAQVFSRFQATTLRQLAGHRSGLRMTSAEDAETRLNDGAIPIAGTLNEYPREGRQKLTEELLTRQHFGYGTANGDEFAVNVPTVPGTAYMYDRGGYIVIGSIIERLLNMNYETAMMTKLFLPLGISTARFGMPTDGKGANTQPQGHRTSDQSPFGISADNFALEPVWNAAGGVAMSLPDYLKFLRLHLNGTENQVTLAASSLAQLHAPVMRVSGTDMTRYAWGWRVDSSDGSILGHDGTYFRFYATAQIYKNQGFIATACANSGNHDGNPGLSMPIPAGAQRGSTAALSLHGELVNKSLIASS
jgi:CubicO group peptidase (beta-lactamase class C family)